ncbi:MAG: hypothetical protein PHE29_06115 [Tissierellia bacterium]|nr:hypothetical protein [Tissierellia bacterium]MDD4779850.1 hypothetical protein [Tissierellia bacterium]
MVFKFGFRLRILTFLLSLLLLMLLIGCNNLSQIGSDLSQSDNNVEAIQTVLKNAFTCPNEEIIYLLEKMKLDEEVSIIGENVEKHNVSKDTLLDKKFREIYGDYFTKNWYNSFVNNYALPNSYIIARYGYDIEVDEVEVKKNDNDPIGYSFVVFLNYGKNKYDRINGEITGSAQCSEEGKISFMRFYGYGEIIEDIRKIEFLSEEEDKRQKEQKLLELTEKLETVEYEFSKIFIPRHRTGRIINNEIIFDENEKEEKDEELIKEENLKLQDYYRIRNDILKQIYSNLNLSFDEKYIIDYKNRRDIEITGNRPINAMELYIYYPEIIVPWQIGDYYFVEAMIVNTDSGFAEDKDEPRHTILPRDISQYNNVKLLYTKGEKSISIEIINVKDIFTLSMYIDELNVEYVHEDAVYTDYMKGPWQADYKGCKLYKYVKYIDDDCYDGFGTFNSDKTYYIAVRVGDNHIFNEINYMGNDVIPNNDNTYDNLVKLIDELNLSEKKDDLIKDLGLE